MEHFTPDTTDGYTVSDLYDLNEELTRRLKGIEPYTDTYWETIHTFEDEVAGR